ncbi:MAG: hypothetical protein AAFY53_13290 [Pseudomonadota bacterium]
MRTFLSAVALGAMTLVTADAPAQASDGLVCQWFAIGVCAKTRAAAVRGARRFGGYVIRTDNIDNFRSGFFCSVVQRNTRGAAFAARNRMRNRGARSAYVKEGCGDL